MADNKVNSGLLEFSEDQKVFVALDAETSEVMKAVTIDGEGVETDIMGVQPTGKKEITTTEEVNVASYATAQVVDEDLVAGNIKKDVDILGVVGTYEPEAPASDFSTAVVTLINNTTSNLDVEIPFYEEAANSNPAYSCGGAVIDPNATATLNVVLYKGTSLAIVLGGVTLAVTGSAESMGGGSVAITGNCSITASSMA